MTQAAHIDQAPRAFSYVRFSTPEQLEGGSLGRQTRRASDYATAKGLVLDERSYRDMGVSGFHGDNVVAGELGAFIEAAQKGDIPRGSYLLIENVDRLSRLPGWRANTLLSNIVLLGITVVDLSGPKEYSQDILDEDPNAFLLLWLDAERANRESARKSDLSRSNWEKKREEAADCGEPFTKVCPGWMEWNEEAGEFQLLGDRTDVVRRIFRKAEEGQGPYSIAKALNEDGVSTFSGGQCWHAGYISKILASDTAIGTLTPHTAEKADKKRGPGKTRKRVAQDPIPDYYPAAVDPALFYRVQDLRKGGNSPRRGRHAGKAVSNLFGGVLKCSRCGAVMIRIAKGRGRARIVCGAAKHGGGCVFESYAYADIEGAFLQQLPGMLHEAPSGDDVLDGELRGVEAGIVEVEERIGRLVAAIEEGTATPEMRARLRELSRWREEEQKRATDLQERQTAAARPFVERKLGELREVLTATPLDRTRGNTLLRQTFTEIRMDFGSGSLLCHWTHGGVSAVFGFWPRSEEEASD